MKRFETFSDFWPFYLREHAKPRTRALHYLGTSLVILLAAAALLTGRWALLIGMPLAGYTFAWLAHFAVEHNRPATFTYPLWSLLADFKMWGMWASGTLNADLVSAGIDIEQDR